MKLDESYTCGLMKYYKILTISMIILSLKHTADNDQLSSEVRPVTKNWRTTVTTLVVVWLPIIDRNR